MFHIFYIALFLKKLSEFEVKFNIISNKSPTISIAVTKGHITTVKITNTIAGRFKRTIAVIRIVIMNILSHDLKTTLVNRKLIEYELEVKILGIFKATIYYLFSNK